MTVFHSASDPALDAVLAPASDRFELYAFWRSSATYRVRVAFNLKGIPVREIGIDLDAGEQRGEAYLAINPLGTLPTLIDRAGSGRGGNGGAGTSLAGSVPIMEFLDEMQPAPPLLPADVHGRARVRSLSEMMASDTHPLITPRIRKYLTGVGGFDADAWRAWQTQWFGTGLRAIEKRLVIEPATGEFCHGDTPTMADICLASVIVVARVFKIEIDAIPTVRRIMAECEKIDAFAKADPGRQAGAPR